MFGNPEMAGNATNTLIKKIEEGQYMENKNVGNPDVIRIHWFKVTDEKNFINPKMRGFVDADDFLRIVRENKPSTIKDVIFNDPATIVFWTDGTKTVVKAENEPFDKEKGLAMAICKRTCGNSGKYFNVFKKYCHAEEQVAEAVEKDKQDKLTEFVDTTLQLGITNKNELRKINEMETSIKKD